MYSPRAFAETDLAQLDALLARDAFITLVTCRDGPPWVSHLPVLYSRVGEQVVLEGHWAKPNPQASHEGPALAIVHGPHAYVSPTWYPDKESAARVPTWNYAVAHLHGTLQITARQDVLADIVHRLSQRHESAIGSDWQFEPERQDHARQLRGIVGFRLPVQQLEMKFKLSQNHPLDNVRSVAEHLARHADDDSRAVAAMMRERLPAD